MKTYEVIAKPVTFRAGAVLALSKDQVARRRHLLTDLGEGVYRLTGTTQFKRGERIGVDGEVSKAMLALLDDAAARKKRK